MLNMRFLIPILCTQLEETGHGASETHGIRAGKRHLATHSAIAERAGSFSDAV